MLKEARVRKGYSVVFVARRLGRSQCNYCNIEAGRRLVPKSAVSKLEELLEIEIPKEMITKNKGHKLKSKNYSQTAVYKTMKKDEIRSNLFTHVIPGEKILTLPSVFGLCVQEAIKNGAIPSDIYCVESDKGTLRDYQSLGLSTNDFHGTMQRYLLYECKERYGVAFLDFCGSLKDSTASEIELCGRKTDRFIGITLNIAYRSVKNPRHNKLIVESVKHLLPDFELYEEPTYYKDEGKTSKMVFLIFKRKGVE